MIVNKKFWDGLPADMRAALETAMKEATVYANDIAKEENDEALEKVKASGKTADLSRPRRRNALALEEGAWCRCTRRWRRASARRPIQAVYKATGFDAG